MLSDRFTTLLADMQSQLAHQSAEIEQVIDRASHELADEGVEREVGLELIKDLERALDGMDTAARLIWEQLEQG